MSSFLMARLHIQMLQDDWMWVQLRLKIKRQQSEANSCYLVSIESPVLEFFLEQWATHVERVVQLAGAVVVEYLREDARMTVEEILVEYRIVVSERLGETRKPRRRDLLQRRLVRLVTDTTHVDRDAVINVGHCFAASAFTNTSRPLGQNKKWRCLDLVLGRTPTSTATILEVVSTGQHHHLRLYNYRRCKTLSVSAVK